MPLQWTPHVIIKFAGTALVTALLASSTTTAAASWLLHDVEQVALVDARPEPKSEGEGRGASRAALLDAAKAKQAAKRRRERLASIVDHNVFCPSCQAIEAEAEAASAAGASGPIAGGALPPTEQPLALLATMESSDPSASIATIVDTERAVTGVFAVNEQIRPGVTLAGVRRGAVTLRVAGALESLGFPADEPPPKRPKKSKKTKKKAKKKNSREIDGAREAIDCSGNDCVVDRRFVDKLIANPSQLMRQARVVPAVRDGQTYGFKLYKVRRGTLPNLLGLRNGDTLLSVNGTTLDSMDQAIALYTKLRRASNLRVSVERKGKVFDKQVSIR